MPDAEFRGLKMIPESHPLQQLFQDLVGRHYAEEIGIRGSRIYVSCLCTMCREEFHSFRRDKQAAGRMHSFVGIRQAVQ